jgi:hypothetical protein
MKRRALALCAGLLLLGLMPASTLANNPTPPSRLDQSADTGGTSTGGSLQAQTFTAGITGPLSGVDLSFAIGGTTTVNVSLQGVHNVAGQMVPDGFPKATASASVTGLDWSTWNWFHFSFSTPPSVTAGTMYAIVFDPGLAGAHGPAADNYAGGQAWGLSLQTTWVPVGNLSDFGFETYIQDTVTTTLAWDKPAVTAGVSTPLKLTATMTFTNGDEIGDYSVLLGDLPSWYVSPTPPTIVCSWGACDLATIQGTGGITVPALHSWCHADGHPARKCDACCSRCRNSIGNRHGLPSFRGSGRSGTSGPGGDSVLRRRHCQRAGHSGRHAPLRQRPAPPTPAPTPTLAPAATPTPSPTPVPTMVVEAATAAPTKAPTPPPTSTGVGPGSDNTGGTIWFLPFALVAAFGGLLVLVDRRRRRLI